MPDGTDPGVTSTAPVETTPTTTPAATGDTTPQATPPAPTAGDGVKAPEATGEQHVPYERFQEVNNKAKEREAELEQARQELAQLKSANTPVEQEPEIDAESQKILDAYMKKQGFVTQAQLDAEKTRLQAAADVRELQSEFSDFDINKVSEYAKENGLDVNNKNGLKAVYQLMKGNDAGAEDAMRNKILAELKESGQLKDPGLEKPGAGGPSVTPGEKPVGTKAIIRDAIRKVRSQ